jgi:putative hydrolase of the HAD superfamily
MTKAAPSRARAVLFTDADNTLWDTNAVYAEAQTWLLDQVETALATESKADDRLAFVRQIDQLLAARHHDGLRYPPKLLVNALALALSGVSDERAVRRAWTEPDSGLPSALGDELQEEFGTRLRRPPRLRAGVADGLRRLRPLGVSVFVLTEGAVDRIRRTLAELDIEAFVDRVLEGKKDAALYRRVLKLMGEPPAAFMIGDQLDRDIAPAKAAGLTTFYFPGGFSPAWTPREVETAPTFKVRSFTEVADTLKESLETPPSQTARRVRGA